MQVARLGLLILLFGLIIHPVQFALVQFCEGYWGSGEIATKLMACRIRHHMTDLARLDSVRLTASEQLRELGQDPHDPNASSIDLSTVPLLVRVEESERAIMNYPHNANDIRPTRLGNVLRHYEADAGHPYGLDLVTVAPHLRLLAPSRHIEYIDDQRTQLDLTIRLVVISVLAAVESVLFLWRDGLWLLVALVPYALAYIFYRGSIIVAAEYGTALATVLDLNRFLLYEALHVRCPQTSRQERKKGADIVTVLSIHEAPPARCDVKVRFRPRSAR